MKVTQKTFDQALAADVVTEAVLRRTRRVFLAAKTQAYAAGRPHMGDVLRIETGRRPGTKSPIGIRRPYGRVIAEVSEEQQIEDNRSAKLSRTKILRRSARG